MHIHPYLAARLVAGRQADLERAATAPQRVRATRLRHTRPAIRIRTRMGWWLIGRGLQLIGRASAATPDES
jgi:hypothetical protein